MALLLLWETDHGMPFPAGGGAGPTAILIGFSRRLQRRVAEDPHLASWLVSKDMQVPLAPGLPDTHHSRWSVQIRAPGADEPRVWYDTFLEKWRSFLASLARPSGVGEMPVRAAKPAPPSSSAMLEPSSPCTTPPLASPSPTLVDRPANVRSAPEDSAAAAGCKRRRITPAHRPAVQRPREEPADFTGAARPAKRQRDLRAWLTPASSSSSSSTPTSGGRGVAMADSGHGRATMGPPT